MVGESVTALLSDIRKGLKPSWSLDGQQVTWAGNFRRSGSWWWPKTINLWVDGKGCNQHYNIGWSFLRWAYATRFSAFQDFCLTVGLSCRSGIVVSWRVYSVCWSSTFWWITSLRLAPTAAPRGVYFTTSLCITLNINISCACRYTYVQIYIHMYMHIVIVYAYHHVLSNTYSIIFMSRMTHNRYSHMLIHAIRTRDAQRWSQQNLKTALETKLPPSLAGLGCTGTKCIIAGQQMVQLCQFAGLEIDQLTWAILLIFVVSWVSCFMSCWQHIFPFLICRTSFWTRKTSQNHSKPLKTT